MRQMIERMPPENAVHSSAAMAPAPSKSEKGDDKVRQMLNPKAYMKQKTTGKPKPVG